MAAGGAEMLFYC